MLPARRLVVFALLVTYLQAHAYGFSQGISIHEQNASLEKVFKAISKQSGYLFLYNDELLEKARPVTLELKDASLEHVLAVCFKNQPLTYSLVENTIVVKPAPARQRQEEVAVSGKVTDKDGVGLPGVTVVLKGTSKGTSTDAEGNFSIGVPGGAGTLVFSYIGFQAQEVETNGRAIINVTLAEDTKALEEVVVVGYGTQKKANLTGAVDQVNAEDIALRPSADITSSLQGLLPGLNIQMNSGDPTATPDINIRGFNSINGGGLLVLIDGIEGNLTRVNPQDIESVTVLKDAASAAIYGARGAFGVILITTKTGKAGEMVVNYTNNFGWTTPTTRTDYISDPYVYGKTVDAALFGYNGTSYTGYNELDWEAIRMVANGEIEPFHELQPNGTYKFFYKTNWYDYLFKKYQYSNMHNISVSGGSDKIKGYLSGRVFERETINNIADAGMDRYNLKANVSFKPTKWLELSDNILFNHDKEEDFGGYRNGYGGIWSTTTWYQLFPFLPNKVDGKPFDLYGQGGPAAMEDAQNWQRFNTEEFTNTFRARATPLENLELNFNYSNRITNTARTYRLNEFEYLTGARMDLQTVGVNRLSEYRWRDYYNALNAYGTYSLNLGAKNNIKVMAGFNQEEFERDRVLAQQGGLLIRDLANLALGTELMTADGSSELWAVQGYFGRFNYDYDARYLLEVNARYDGSSRFPSESRWGWFPSVSVGWQVNRESFWQPIENTFSFLKLRASYGSLGNQNISTNTFQQTMSIGRSEWLDGGQQIIYAGAPAPLPKVVSWETTSTINFGADMGFFRNRLTASIDVYQKDTEDMYLPGTPLPGVFGATEPKENLASLRNRGFDLSLGYNNSFEVVGSPLAVRATASVTNFKGTITKFDNPNGLMSSYWEGQELGQIWGYHVDGQFQSDEEAIAYQNSFVNPSNSLGNVYNYILNVVQNNDWNQLRAGDIKYVDVDGDGRIDRGNYTLEDHGDLQPIGNAMPKFPFGFNVSASWKGLDLSVAGAGVAKQNWYPTGDIYWGTYQRPYLSFLRKDLVDNAWTPETPGNRYPQIERGYAALNSGRSLNEMNDYYLENIGYLRVKNLTLGYTLPEALTSRASIKKLRVYLSGENLFTWRFGNLTKYIDPEQAGSAIDYSNPGDAVNRADLRSYPMGKTYSMGINVTL
ncbi:SusC/RagA family TonB-linked outer membrane protein [Pontibacter actiniarum]|uniref:SusC/RagA family TonB-linked outer membrane protein n=2 Tax=Pontibacter actiniarum TaxID=323450 RepID=A0A1X9YQL7_9BACT|nr:SusC/RagA family TonB-linked outer membrane protein [Pontibacter actiniarum]